MVDVCRCGKFSMENAVVKYAPSKFCNKFLDDTLGNYCGNCGNFHHVKQEEDQVVRGPVDARALLSASVKSNGQRILTWSVGDQVDKARDQVQTIEFFPWPRSFRMTETEPLIHLTWELLMSKVKVILDPMDQTELGKTRRDAARSEARGIAEVLAIQMKPFMESADHVVRCAVKTHEDPEFKVPGLGSHLWDPMYNPDGSERIPVSTPRATRTPPRAAPKKAAPVKHTGKLKDSDKEGVRAAIESGMFTEQDMADMYKVSIDEIKAAVS